MSVATRPEHVTELTRKTLSGGPTRMLFRLFLAFVVVADVTVLLLGILLHPESIGRPGWVLIAWAAFTALLGLVPIQTEAGPELALDLPLLLASGFLFGPIAAGTLAFVAYVDLREWRGEITHARATFNRAQTSLSVMAASLTFHLLGGEPGRWPLILAIGTAALLIDVFVNYLMVALAMRLSESHPVSDIFVTLRLGSREGFFVSYACFGLLALLIAEVSNEIGLWGLLALAIPLLLARQAFSHGQGLDKAQEQLHLRGRTIEALSTRIQDERRDERLVVASGLHDDVLPSLHRVHLMGQVLRQDLAHGKLLELEDDLPQLLAATEAASDSIRQVIKALGKSPIGPDGLETTLRLTAKEIEMKSGARIAVRADAGGASPAIQLLVYQLAREALRNAVAHSGASRIDVEVRCEGESLRLLVRDDGRGFNPTSIDAQAHFGLGLMRDRVELLGGAFYVDTKVGIGTTVVARLPLDLDPPAARPRRSGSAGA